MGLLLFFIAKPIVDLDGFTIRSSLRPRWFVVVFVAEVIVDLEWFMGFRSARLRACVVLVVFVELI